MSSQNRGLGWSTSFSGYLYEGFGATRPLAFIEVRAEVVRFGVGTARLHLFANEVPADVVRDVFRPGGFKWGNSVALTLADGSQVILSPPDSSEMMTHMWRLGYPCSPDRS